MSFHVEFHPPWLPGTGQKVCVVVVGEVPELILWLRVTLVLALVQNYGLGFGFGLGPS